jgi:Transglutaminase-like superfamily
VRRILREIIAARSIGDALLLGRILLFALLVPLALRRNLASVAAFLEPRRPPPAAPKAMIEKILRYADTVCASRLVRAECLVRGLTRYYFLRRAGLSLGVVFGMGEVNGHLEGHCWLVNDGRPFMEAHDPEPHFKQMLTFPLARP